MPEYPATDQSFNRTQEEAKWATTLAEEGLRNSRQRHRLAGGTGDQDTPGQSLTRLQLQEVEAENGSWQEKVHMEA